MSHFTTIKTRLTDADALARALEDVGFKEIEIHETAQHLCGYRGDCRRQTAEVIIRKQHVGRASNDLGFKKRSDGGYDAIISAYDRPKYNELWLQKLTQRYAYHVSRQKLKEQGFDLVTENSNANGQIHLVLRRAV